MLWHLQFCMLKYVCVCVCGCVLKCVVRNVGVSVCESVQVCSCVSRRERGVWCQAPADTGVSSAQAFHENSGSHHLPRLPAARPHGSCPPTAPVGTSASRWMTRLRLSPEPTLPHMVHVS